MKEPTTIPEYKQFCKALKLKILKQKTTIETQNQEIEKLNNEIKILKKSGLQVRNQNDPTGSMTNFKLTQTLRNTAEVEDLETLKGRNEVMDKFKNGACSFGITPQSIFRIADFAYKNQVEADYFRKVLSKIDLGLTQMEISTLIYIFDENCTGFIHRDDFNDALNAYQISLQQSYLAYTSLCLQKLAKLMEADKLQILKFYQQMEVKNTNGVDLNRFHDKMKATFGKRLQMKQIMGAFNAIDLENDGLVTKKNFVYAVTAALNKMASQSQMRRTDELNTQYNPNERSTFSNKKSTFNQTPIPNNSRAPDYPRSPDKIDNSASRITVNINKGDANLIEQEAEVLAKIYNDHKVTLHQIYEQICRSDLEKRLTLIQFKKTINSVHTEGNKIEPQLSSMLFRMIDYNKRGTIYYKQLIYFYLRHETDMSIIFHLFGIFFKNNDLNAQKYWFMNGVSVDSDISKAKFMQIMGKTFGGADASNDVWQKFWSYFDKGKGVVSVASITKQLSKYQLSQ